MIFQKSWQILLEKWESLWEHTRPDHWDPESHPGFGRNCEKCRKDGGITPWKDKFSEKGWALLSALLLLVIAIGIIIKAVTVGL